MQFKNNKLDIIIISVMAFLVTVGFVYAKFELTLSEQKRLILHVLNDRSMDLELYLTHVIKKAEDKIKYISYNTNINKKIDFLFNKDDLDTIDIAIIDQNKSLIKTSENFDRNILEGYLNKKLGVLSKIKHNNIVWYYGECIKNKLIATAKDTNNSNKVIFILDFQKVLHNLSHSHSRTEQYFKNFNIALLDNNENLTIVSDEAWLKSFDKTILDRFIQKGYERKARIFQFSGNNYLLRKVKAFPFNILISINHKEIAQNTVKILFVQLIEIVGGIVTFLLLILLIFKDKLLKQKLARAYNLAKRSSEAKTEFLNFAAHEIKSPLSCITSTAEILTNKTLGDSIVPYAYYVDSVKSNAQLIVDFVDDVLEEDLILKGKFKIHEKASEITQIVDRSIEINKVRYKHRKISLVKSIPQNLPKLFCDERRILQILNNLISNAIKFSYDGKNVTVGANLSANGLQIFVKDEGLGMYYSEIASLKQNSNNVNKAQEEFESHGIGFNIVKILAAAHNAKIEIFSQIEKGTNIVVTFPMNKLKFE